MLEKSEISAKVSKIIGATHLESPINEFKKFANVVDLNLNDKGRFLFYLASNLIYLIMCASKD